MRLLIVGSSNHQVVAASKIAQNKGANVAHVAAVNNALEELRGGKGYSLVMIDVKLDVSSFINSLKDERINIAVVGYGFENDTQSAVRAIKAGAKEYIPLPPDEDMIAAVIAAITEESGDFIYASPPMQEVIRLADQVAKSEASILITGPSGTGKEVLAKYIHKHSNRASANLVSVNCAAIPDNLLESELFGHEKGAFTGAVARRIGKFEEANNSTLLLDEISEMDLRLQAKLLRALQEREIDRVGGNAPVKVNIRIIATSNRNLQEEVKKGNFREDLFFRLNVINLRLPALRERREEIKLLAANFIKKFSALNNVPVRQLTEDALQKLENYSWPGNVRELENTIHRAVLVSSGSNIVGGDIILTGEPDNDNGANIGNFVGRTVESVEKELILNTLDHCLGNRTHAANILGISIRTLRNKLSEYEKVG